LPAVFGYFDFGRIGEVNLLLQNLESTATSVVAATRRVFEMADRIGKRPLPDDYIQICIELSLVHVEDEMIWLTSLGRQLKDHIDLSRIHKLNESQTSLVESEILDHPELRLRIRAAVDRMELWKDGTRRFRTSPEEELTPEERSGFSLLQSLLIMEWSHRSRTLTLGAQASSRLLESDYEIHGVTENELWDKLDRQRIRGREAEELIVGFEKERLLSIGEPQLSSLVRRVSEYDVSAGYDVKSYDPDFGELFIEVKSSASSRFQFYWTTNERSKAVELAGSYWIYFVPHMRESMAELKELIKIDNPIAKIGSILSEIPVPSNFEVTMPNSSSLVDQGMVGSTQVKAV